MTNEKKGPSWMKRVVTVILLFVGSVGIWFVLLSICSTVLFGFPLAYVYACADLIVGATLVWVAMALWDRWRAALGVIWLALGILSMSNNLRFLPGRYTGMGYSVLAPESVTVGIGVIGAAFGLKLFVTSLGQGGVGYREAARLLGVRVATLRRYLSSRLGR